MDRRAFLAVFAAAAASCQSEKPVPTRSGARVVSLSPGITDALYAIGAGSLVVARSDYCYHPPEVTRLPRVGTSITPNYEAIARLEPTLIVSEDNAATRRRELEALAPTALLKWLSLDEVSRGIRELGRFTDKAANARALAERLERRLSVPVPEVAFKILLVTNSDMGRLDDIWFIRKNSLQGAALHAAGAQNAIAEDIAGQPRLSLERLVELDPDAIVVLALREGNADSVLAPYLKLTALRAVRNNRVTVVPAPEAYVNGPRVLALVDRLIPVVQGLKGRR